MASLKMRDKPAVVMSFGNLFFNLKFYLRSFRMKPKREEAAS